MLNTLIKYNNSILDIYMEKFDIFVFRDKLSAFMESKGAPIPGMLVLTQNLSKVRVALYSIIILLRA